MNNLLRFSLAFSVFLGGMGTALPLVAQKKGNVNPFPYPYGNPVVKHMYTADASPHVMPDGRVWMVTSVDHPDGGGYATMHSYHTFSSADMVQWVDHGEVLNVWDVIGSDKEPEGEDWALWAPDMIYHNGKYYLYFPLRILHTDTVSANGGRVVTSYIAVAESNSPDERFTVINPKIQGTRGIDPAVFLDDDGKKYLYFGNHFGALLTDDMRELATAPVHMEVHDDHFMEAIWMHKRAEKYFLSYHRHYGKPIDPNKPDDPEREKSRLDFGVSDSPLGPFQYQGVLNRELGVNVNEGPVLPGYDFVPWRLYQSNHGGIVEFHGKEYLFYHTSALSSWWQDYFEGPGTWTQRSVCVDEIVYDNQGMPLPVQQSLRGVDLVRVTQPALLTVDFSTAIPHKNASLRDKSIQVTGGNASVTFPRVNLGSGYYYARLQAQGSEQGAVEFHLDSADGPLIGTILFRETGAGPDVYETFLRGGAGIHDLVLVYTSDNKKDSVTLSALSCLAGAPAAVKMKKTR